MLAHWRAAFSVEPVILLRPGLPPPRPGLPTAARMSQP